MAGAVEPSRRGDGRTTDGRQASDARTDGNHTPKGGHAARARSRPVVVVVGVDVVVVVVGIHVVVVAVVFIVVAFRRLMARC